MLATLSVFLIAAAPMVDPEPPSPQPVVKFRGAASRNGHTYLTFEVSNAGSKPIPYLGYEGKPDSKVISPLYSTAQKKGTAWKESGGGWCGTGIGPVAIPARGKVTFTASVPTGDWDEIKVGLRWYQAPGQKGKALIAWSDAITRKAAGVK